MPKKQKFNPEEIEIKPADQSSEEVFFDDCPICRAIKSAKEKGRNPTLTELKEAFKQAKEEGGVVGGEMFEE